MPTVTEYRFVTGFTTGLSTVGYTLYDGAAAVTARATAGVAESPAGSGEYGADVTYDPAAVNRIGWDAGTSPNRYAAEGLPATGTGATGTGLGPGSDPYDLVSAAACAEYIAAGGVTLTAAQSAALPALITAASGEVQRYARRTFALTAYDEVLTPYRGQPDKGEPDWVDLTNFPVQSVAHARVGPAVALTLGYTGAGQRASAAYTFTGDPEVAVTRTGLTLASVASGVASQTAVAWTVASPYTTVSAVAAVINAVPGWQATATAAYAGHPAADLWGPLTPSAAAGAGAVRLGLFGDDAAVLGCDYRTGTLTLAAPPPAGSGAWAWWPDPAGGSGSGGPGPRVRVSYAAGWAAVPAAVQRACAELVKATLDRLRTDSSLKSETAKDYTYVTRDAWRALPPHVIETLNLYRVYR